MNTTDPFTEAARAEAEAVMSEARERVGITVQEQTRYVEGHVAGADWARAHLAAQEESVLMTLREETISDRLSDAGYIEYAEDEDGGVTWVSAPLGEVLRIVSAAQEPTDAEKAVRELHNADGFQWVGFPRADKREVYCTRCHDTAPCPTIRALDGDAGR